jgi:DNA-binding GntR family transcriptional regulator
MLNGSPSRAWLRRSTQPTALAARAIPAATAELLVGISRVTLRKALTLVNRGILTASHGRGWFVASPSRGWFVLRHEVAVLNRVTTTRDST